MPEDLRFAPKTEIARDLISAALDAGVPCRWVLADALYGSDSRLRRMLEGRGRPYVLAVPSNYQLRFLDRAGVIQTDPAAISEAFEADDWTMLPAGGREGLPSLRLGMRSAHLDVRSRPRAVADDPPQPLKSE